MSNNFLFDAPTYFDFDSQTDSENTINVESYFDTDHEGNKEVIKFEHRVEVKEQVAEHVLPLEENASAEPLQEIQQPMRLPRRSLSTGNLFNVNGQSIIVANKSTVRTSSTKEPELVRCVSRNTIYNLAKPKNINANTSKYVSMAEAINQFYNKTPDRFHTKTKGPQIMLKKNCVATIPNSPHLMTKQRARSKHILSQKELEEKEIEEAKKFKIKANPINPRIFQGPVKPMHIKKPGTVVEPFHLTEPTAKVNVMKSPEPFEFHAKPVPKSIYNTPKNVPKIKKQISNATPQLHHNGLNETKKQQAAKDHAVKLTKTQPMPFSFEERDKEVMKKKIEHINKVFEEERKAREFHAKPPPRYLSGKCNGSVMSIRSNKSEDDVDFVVPPFKARPPTVLYKKPFQPKKTDCTLVEITEFELNTERRARDRQEFENEMKKKDEQLAALKKEAERRQEEFDKQQRAEMRKQAEYKANPVRHYKEVKIVPSQKVTIPLSPALRTAGVKNKENAQ